LQPRLEIADPGRYDQVLLSQAPLVFLVRDQRLARTMQGHVVEDREIQMCRSVIGTHGDGATVRLLGAQEIASFAMQRAEPVVRDRVVGIGLDRPRQARHRELGLSALRIEDAQVGQRTGEIREVVRE